MISDVWVAELRAPGFVLLVAIYDRASALLASEGSRLARNGRDWLTLIEFLGWSPHHRRRGWPTAAR